ATSGSRRRKKRQGNFLWDGSCPHRHVDNREIGLLRFRTKDRFSYRFVSLFSICICWIITVSFGNQLNCLTVCSTGDVHAPRYCLQGSADGVKEQR
ncbi:unnamed protein product, partial [Heterotrigona itama]